jgi:hypothetical protein
MEPAVMRMGHDAGLPESIAIEPHYSPQFLAELWRVSPSTVVRWFQDREGVLKMSRPAKNCRPSRVELRIPYSLAQRVYQERTRSALE